MRFVRNSRVRWGGGIVVAAVVIGFAATIGQGVPAVSVPLRTGQAWLQNAKNGTASLIDGFSGKSIGQARAANAAGHLSVVNTPNGAVVVDAAGHINRIDIATMRAGTPRTIFSNTTAVANGSSIYAVDESTGEVQQLAVSGPGLKPVGRPVDLHSAISSALVDNSGKFWAALPERGSLASVQDGHVGSVGGIGTSNDKLAVVQAANQVVGVDLNGGEVSPVSAGSAISLDSDLADIPAITAVGSDTRHQLALISTSKVVAVDLASRHVRSIELPSGTQPSAAVMAGANVDLIDASSGGVLVVHTLTGKVDPPIMLPNGRADELILKDGQVFVNDSTGAAALVLHPNGTISGVTKYTTKSTQQALHPPRSVTQVPQTRTPLPGGNHTGNSPGNTPHHNGSTGPGTTPGATAPPPVKTRKPPAKLKHGVPGIPGGPEVSAGNATITVGWAAAAPNGAPVDSYTITWAANAGPTASHIFRALAGTPLTWTIPNLANGTSYTVSVAARNKFGLGLPATARPVVPSSSVPGIPSGVSAQVTNANQVTVTWTAPDNGYHIASYAVFNAANTSLALTDGATATTATIPTSDAMPVGQSVSFVVQAKNAAGTVGSFSRASTAVTPFGPPGAPDVAGTTVADDGMSGTVSLACDETCLQGAPSAQTFSATVDPTPAGGQPTTATASNNAATIDVSGLTAGTMYTVTASVHTAGGDSTAMAYPPLNTPGPAKVTSIAWGPTSDPLTMEVTPTVETSGEATTCSYSVDNIPGSTPIACNGSGTVPVTTYYATYTVRVTAENAASDHHADTEPQSGVSGDKPLTTDSTEAFGTCPAPGHKYCGGDSGSYPSPAFAQGTGNPKPQGTQVELECQLQGGNVTSYNEGSSTQWVRLANDSKPYMNILYFPNYLHVTDQLPAC